MSHPKQTRPILILVTGPPGSGKSTLAHRLGTEIGCPVISRDEIKQGIVLAASQQDSANHKLLNLNALVTFFEVVEALLHAGVTTIAEAAFKTEVWQPNLGCLDSDVDLRVVRCVVEQHVSLERMRTRMTETDRSAHADSEYLLSPTAFEPVKLSAPTLDVDTTEEYQPSIQKIISFALSRN